MAGNMPVDAYLMGGPTGSTAVVDTELPAAAALGDGAANPTAPAVAAHLKHRNGAGTWDDARGNLEGTALASAARTATTQSGQIDNPNGRGVILTLNITAASGTGGLQVTVQSKDPVTGTWSQINTTPTAILTASTFLYCLYPGEAATNVAGFSQVANAPLPRTWRVNVIHGDGSSYTYSVGYAIIL